MSLQKAKIHTDYQENLLTNFKRSTQFEVGFNRGINQYGLDGPENVFYTVRFFANVEVTFAEGFSFVADWSYYNYSNCENTLQNKYPLADATLRYQKTCSNCEFEVDGNNLLNVKSLNRDSFNQSFSSTSEYYI